MGLEFAKRYLEGTGDPVDKARAAVIAAVLNDRGVDVPLPNGATPERPLEVSRFNDVDREALLKAGALIYELTGETIEDQQGAGRKFWYVTDGGDKLLEKPSRRGEIAIFPDPNEFFIPESGGKSLADQEKLASRDTKALQKRLNTKGLKVIIPEEASTLTEITFKHLEETGEWLFGERYGYNYGRTKNSTNKSGSSVAVVGSAFLDNGLFVNDWDRGDGFDSVRVVRLVVPSGI